MFGQPAPQAASAQPDLGRYDPAQRAYHLPAKITHAEAEAVGAALSQAVRQNPTGSGAGSGAGKLVLQAAALQQFDSSALAAILACRRQLAAQGLGLEMQNAPARLHDLAQLYGVDQLLFPAG